MLPLECGDEVSKNSKAGRSKLNSIPAMSIANIFNIKAEDKKKREELAVKQSEKLCDELCNSYKFVVNYGVFEANFEWLPLEVNRKRNFR